MLIDLVSLLAPVFLITGVGYLWALTKQRFDVETVTMLVLYIGTPCLIFSTLTSLKIDMSTFGDMTKAAGLAVAIAAGIALLFLGIFRYSIRTYLPPLMLPNSGNVGLPIALLVFGDQGLALGVSYFFVIALLQYTLGYAIASGEADAKRLLNQPMVYAVILVLIVFATGAKMPMWITKTTEILGSIVIPAMLILLGTSLARLKVTDMANAVLMSVMRLSIGVVTGTATIYILGLSGKPAGVAFLMAVMPASVASYVFAERYLPRPEEVAGTVVTSTFVSFLMMPILAWIGLRIASGDIDIARSMPAWPF